MLQSNLNLLVFNNTPSGLPVDQTIEIVGRKSLLINEQVKIKPRILVAEDNNINQLVLSKHLKSLGFDFDIAEDGQEALSLWLKGGYTLVISDVNMPKMNGYILTLAIRDAEASNKLPHIPVIAYTSSSLPGEEERCKAAGMDDYLLKPTQLSSLKAILAKWMECELPA